MIRELLYGTTVTLLLVSCGNSEKSRQEKMIRQAEEVENIKKELWKIHDDVMPKTSRIYQLKKCIDAVTGTGNVPAESAAALADARQRLENADKAMFKWMHDISDLEKKTDMPFEEQKKQYQAQLPLVEAVRDSMLNSIRDAEKLLTSYENTCTGK